MTHDIYEQVQCVAADARKYTTVRSFSLSVETSANVFVGTREHQQEHWERRVGHAARCPTNSDMTYKLRENMPRSYYDGFERGIVAGACLSVNNDVSGTTSSDIQDYSQQRISLARILEQNVVQKLAPTAVLTASDNSSMRPSPSSFTISELVGNQRAAVSSILDQRVATINGRNYDEDMTQYAQPLERMREALPEGMPIAYYCGHYDGVEDMMTSMLHPHLQLTPVDVYVNLSTLQLCKYVILCPK